MIFCHFLYRNCHGSPTQTKKSQPKGKQIMPEIGFTRFPALSVHLRLGFLGLHWNLMIDYFSYFLLETALFL